jgi:hypothetical protein
MVWKVVRAFRRRPVGAHGAHDDLSESEAGKTIMTADERLWNPVSSLIRVHLR